MNYKFAWQTGYGAFSVSESMVSEVEKYITNQKEHHKKMTYEEEIDLFITKYGLKIINRWNGYYTRIILFLPTVKTVGCI